MARSLARSQPGARETQFADQFESAELLTLGIIYEKLPALPARLQPATSEGRPLQHAAITQELARARRLRVAPAGIDADVKKIIAGLTARGFKSPYLRNYVVARINPVRFKIQKRGDTARRCRSDRR